MARDFASSAQSNGTAGDCGIATGISEDKLAGSGKLLVELGAYRWRSDQLRGGLSGVE
jgi:hypothetical protein